MACLRMTWRIDLISTVDPILTQRIVERIDILNAVLIAEIPEFLTGATTVHSELMPSIDPVEDAILTGRRALITIGSATVDILLILIENAVIARGINAIVLVVAGTDEYDQGSGD